MKMTKNTWRTIFKIIAAVITTIGGVLGIQAMPLM